MRGKWNFHRIWITVENAQAKWTPSRNVLMEGKCTRTLGLKNDVTMKCHCSDSNIDWGGRAIYNMIYHIAILNWYIHDSIWWQSNGINLMSYMIIEHAPFTWGPFYYYGLILISGWTRNHMPSKRWDCFSIPKLQRRNSWGLGMDK